MTLEQLRERIDNVIACAGDPEHFHGEEDKLMEEWIRSRATPEEIAEWDRLDHTFTRWYA